MINLINIFVAIKVYGPMHKPDTSVAPKKLIIVATGQRYGDDHCEPTHNSLYKLDGYAT